MANGIGQAAERICRLTVVAGDFNGDGQTDILWQNTSTGERGIYLMNGTTVTGWVSLGIVPTVWAMKN